jgi:tetratricopeptide (TPR) repeat protein
MDLGTEYYNGNDMATAGEWFDKVLAVDAQNVNGLLARGAVYFNLGAFADAERTWLLVVDVEPDNVEAHYDLGFLYLNQSPPDWTGVQSEWNKVIDLDPTSELAATVKSHLESLAGASMLPASSADPGATPSAAPSVSATP